jgi:hypothetical protein
MPAGRPSEYNKMIKLSTIKPNPSNPRVIKDDKFHKLVNSIKEFPKMLELRPMVVNEDNVLLGGNMRLKALQHLKYEEIPNTWVKQASELTEEEQRQFIIKDNVGFGEWDWEMLANSWNNDELSEWGLDVPNQEDNTSEIKEQEIRPYIKSHILLSFPPEKFLQVEGIISTLITESWIEYEQTSN